MGILNVTPDSFADGGRFVEGDRVDVEAAVAAAQAMAAAGAAIIDVGGESTRPGAAAVDTAEELRRVIPVVERIAAFGTIVSVDTSKAAVARAALEAGAHMINDVRAGSDAGLLDTVARHGAALCLMHMRGEPRTMQDAPEYHDVVAEVRSFLAASAMRSVAAGIDARRIVVDPGFGFGKTLTHNLLLLEHLDAIVGLGYPVLVGLSRKRTIGALTGRDVPAERVFGSVAAAVLAIERGADIVRVHDVEATMDAIRVVSAVKENSSA
jgi:dihydropteroate synthase